MCINVWPYTLIGYFTCLKKWVGPLLFNQILHGADANTEPELTYIRPDEEGIEAGAVEG